MLECLLTAQQKKQKTLLLMHMDKVGTRNYTDERGTTVTTAANAGLIRTAAGRTGSYFCMLGGENGLVTPEFSWIPGASDWTMEFWCNRFSAANFMRGKTGTVANAAHVSFDVSGNANFYINNTLIYTAGAHVIGLNSVWGHIAFVRKGDSFSLYIGGVLRATLAGATYPALRSAVFRPFNLTDLGGFSSHNYAQYTDELRISNVARYSSNFTPSATNFALD